ncbi:hypothetical protein [Lysobacter brunescens]|uniref:TonB-dependent receptor n=1 Tax=Lysobacter brunescens TaxID=262323 RepID=A0ABW2Y9T0_9GAMM
MSMPRTTVLAIALCACTASLPAFADDTPAERKAPRSERPEPTTGSRIVERNSSDLDEILVIGAIHDPADAALPQDTSVPPLPAQADAGKTQRRGRATTGSRIPDSQLAELDEVRIVGAVHDPADAGLADDASLPDLPVVIASTMRGR